jgi:DNA (cytosine-5)-methyltransferase 1
MKPKLLDLFCCEGGASMGYSRAGFDVYGVDLFEDYSQKRYPFPSGKFDVFEFLGNDLNTTGLDVIVASPPCQRYSITNAARKCDYPDLIGPTREALIATGLPYVIENVAGAPLLNPLTLCGSMFGLSAIDDDGTPLRMERHRLFESNVMLYPPGPCNHDKTVQVAGSYGGARRDKDEARLIRKGGYVPSIPVQRELLGIDWMTQKGMHQSIPPAYTEFIGAQLLAHLTAEQVA